jgi:biopolymer transport protein ExbD
MPLFKDAGAPARGPELGDGMDITPMIDMTFLLLIFFMVTSTMQVESRLQMPPAGHGQGVPLEEAVVMSVLKTGDEPQIVQGDKPSGTPMQLAEVGAYVSSELSSGGKHTIIIKADRDIPSGFVEEVARAANEAAPEDMELQFFVGVQDKQK